MSNRFLANMVRYGTPPIVRFNVEQYSRMREFGILEEGAPIELIDGIIVYKDRRDGPPQVIGSGPRCLLAQKRTAKALECALQGRPYHVQQHGPVVLNSSTQVLLDLCVLKGQPEDYAERLPARSDLILAAEIVDHNNSFESREKAQILGEAGIAAYWIVHVFQETVTVRDRPFEVQTDQVQGLEPILGKPDRFSLHERARFFQRRQSIPLLLNDGSSVDVLVDDLLHPNGLP